MEALVPHPTWDLVINSHNVSRSLDPYVMSVTYEDHEEGEADTVDISLEDRDGLLIDAWYPTKGDNLDLWIGFSGQPLLSCGHFEVDEITYNGPPEIMTLRALAAGIDEPRRTRKAVAYEGTTLAEVVAAVAKRAKLTLVGTVEPIAIRRATQIHESDIEFLRRIGNEYGYAFNIKGKQLVFYKRSALTAATPVLTLDRKDIRPYSFRDKIKDVVEQAQVYHHDPKTKSLKRAKATSTVQASGDTLRINRRAESARQAQAQADAALEAANREATTFEGTVPGGDLRLVAGVNFEARGFGKLSGVYHTKLSRHVLNRLGGYTTQFEARRVSGG